MSCLFVKIDKHDGTVFINRELILEVDHIESGVVRSVNVFKRQITEMPSGGEAIFELDKQVECWEFNDLSDASTGTYAAGISILRQLGVRSS